MLKQKPLSTSLGTLSAETKRTTVSRQRPPGYGCFATSSMTGGGGVAPCEQKPIPVTVHTVSFRAEGKARSRGIFGCEAAN
jgi:hypothetical protein